MRRSSHKPYGFSILVFVCWAMLAVPAPAAETSQTIAFTGCDDRLTGPVDVRLRLVTAGTGGTLVFEETQRGVDGSSGCISVRIGVATEGGIPPNVFTSNPSLGIVFALDSDPSTELGGGWTPITNSGYAFKASTAETAATVNPGATISGDVMGAALKVINRTAGAIYEEGAEIAAPSTSGIEGDSSSPTGAGVYGHATSAAGSPSGVYGEVASAAGYGVFGLANSAFGGIGVYGKSTKSWGVRGDSTYGEGVLGLASAAGQSGVSGRNDTAGGYGTRGFSMNGIGVWGFSNNSWGVRGDSTGDNGVQGFASVAGTSGVAGRNDNPGGYGIRGSSLNGLAGFFDNKVQVNSTNSPGLILQTPGTNLWTALYFTEALGAGRLAIQKEPNNDLGFWTATGPAGSETWTQRMILTASGNLNVNGQTTTKVLQITGGSDLSEQFEVSAAPSARDQAPKRIEPGMVVSIDPENPGKLMVSDRAYDRRVAGIISGAGGVQTGMRMSQSSSIADGEHPVALTGRVYVWADASNGAIVPGDLLTTSNIPGHAMKVTNYGKAQGAIIGKAMTGLARGNGLVLVLVTLQ